MNREGKLLGSFLQEKIHVSGTMRSHYILKAAGFERPSEDHTADHKISSETLNDSIANLSWGTKSDQRNNQDAHVFAGTHSTFSGTLLPPHPVHHEFIQLSSEGFVKILGRWSTGSKQTGSRAIKINGHQFLVHVLMVEAVLGRVLVPKVEVADHINGDHALNLLSNLAPVYQFDNSQKAVIKLITRIDSENHAVVFGGIILSHEATERSDRRHIMKCMTGGRKTHAGFQWKDSSEEEIDLFFTKMAEVDVSRVEWPEFQGMDRYENLMKSIQLFNEWKTTI